MTKQEIISRIKQHKDKNGVNYKAINVSGGTRLLEDADYRQLMAMMRSIEKRVERNSKQLTFNY